MSLPLAKQADPSQVEVLRPLVEGKPCVVVGSAPLKTPTATIAPGEVVIAVNGGISSLLFRHAHVWVLNSKAQDRPGSVQLREMHRLMLEQAGNASAQHLLLLRGPKVASEAFTLETLRKARAQWDSWSVFDKPTKRWLEGELCGRVEDKAPCSSGLLTVAMACYCGASSVRLVGFSLTPGYHYRLPKHLTPQRWWRDHVEADTRGMAHLVARYGAALSGEFVQRLLKAAS